MGTLEVNFRTQIAEELSRTELIDRLCEYHDRIKQLEESLNAASDPEQRPHVCPVCCGRQYAPMGFYDGNISTALNTELCRTCGGTGIVWEPEIDSLERKEESK